MSEEELSFLKGQKMQQGHEEELSSLEGQKMQEGHENKLSSLEGQKMTKLHVAKQEGQIKVQVLKTLQWLHSAQQMRRMQRRENLSHRVYQTW